MRRREIDITFLGNVAVWLVLAAGAVESVWGLLQLCGLAEPGHALYLSLIHI